MIQSYFHKGWDTVVSNAQYIKQETENLVQQSNTLVIRPVIKTIKGYSPIFQEGLEKLKSLAITLFKIIVALAAIKLQPLFFMIGAASALVFPEIMQKAMDRLSIVWNDQSKSMSFLIGATMVYYWAQSFLISAPFIGAKVCLYFQEKAGRAKTTQVKAPPTADGTSEIAP